MMPYHPHYSVGLTVFAAICALVTSRETQLAFTAAAQSWDDTLPIGNGRLGATAFGKPDNETIVLNEDSFYNGRFTNRVNAKSLDAFPKVRGLMDQGSLTEAGDTWLDNMVGVPKTERKYEPAGYLSFTTGHSQPSNYTRALDLETGITNTTYVNNGVTYYREAVASAVDNVIAFQFWASQPSSHHMTIRLDRGSNIVATTGSDGGFHLRSSGADDSGYTHSQYAFVTSSGGTITSSGSSIIVKGATNVTIVWDAETLFYYPQGQSTYEQVLNNRVRSASSKGYDAIASAAVTDHQSYFSRAFFSAGVSNNSVSANKPIDARLADLKQVRDFTQDPEILALGYNYGRYMLIASSRPGTLPANLQGIWNNKFNPPWDSKFTIDINLQMNYWGADMNGLTDMLLPLWDHFKLMQTHGTDVASTMYGLPGWVCHHNTDLWGDCAPQSAGTQWTIWPMGGAWTLDTAVEHYRFTKDLSFARDTALPLLQGAVEFYNNFSVLQDGYYVTYPSNSPENSYKIPSGKTTAGQTTGIDQSSQSDRALMYMLYTGFIELSNAVGSTTGVAAAETYLSKLKAPDISTATNRLMEWSEDYAETEPGHRHFSPCIGLHPGNQYSSLTNATLTSAAQALISHRLNSGGGSTGWSRIWASHLNSRLFNGNDAAMHANVLMTNYMYNNMWSITSNTFQADANYGLTSAVNEMFLQSHMNGIVHIGPAMPNNQLLQGNFRGWKARGNFQVDAAWSEGQITSAEILSGSGSQLAVRVQGGRAFKVNGATYTGPITTTAGSTYTISF